MVAFPSLTESQLAQAPSSPTSGLLPKSLPPETIWMGASGLLLLLLLLASFLLNAQAQRLKKELNKEIFRNRELQKKYKLALSTISKMEKNPDLIHSREFNLDYLRMRMAEDVFHYAILVQIKMKVKQQIAQALRPKQAAVGEQGTGGTAGVARQVDSTFDVVYETGEGMVTKKRVLFRIQIRLMKLPTQTTSKTIDQIIDCLETYLSPSEDHDIWQPTIQGRLASIRWDQKAKPTPMLVLEQSNEGMNVTLKVKRQTPGTGLIDPETISANQAQNQG